MNSDNITETASSILAVIFVVLISLFTLFILQIFARKQRVFKSDEELDKRYGTLYTEFKNDNFA